MADKHPYMSGTAGLIQAINQLRKSFPGQVTSETLKKLAIAPNNETYVLNILRFISVLDTEGKKGPGAAGVFNQHADEDFQRGLTGLVQPAYSELFGLHGDAAWELPTDKLIAFFRAHDHTSDIVGRRQASTFQVLAALCGKSAEAGRPANSPGQPAARAKPTPKPKAPKVSSTAAPPIALAVDSAPAASAAPSLTTNGVALTVRVEINLPAGGDQETYDRIFRSIRENLLNGNVS